MDAIPTAAVRGTEIVHHFRFWGTLCAHARSIKILDVATISAAGCSYYDVSTTYEKHTAYDPCAKSLGTQIHLYKPILFAFCPPCSMLLLYLLGTYFSGAEMVCYHSMHTVV